MATSGTYAFNPNLGSLSLYAFNRCGIRNTAVLQEHIESARMASNMVLADWSNKGVNLWEVDLQTVPLVQGTATYSVPQETVVILDAYVTQNQGNSAINRIILPISRSEYATYPNPNQQGAVTVYWLDRLISPSVTLWQVPDGTQSSLSYYRVKQIQDSAFTNGQTVDIPYLWMKAFSDALSTELAVIWAPERVPMLAAMADKSYQIAATQNEEQAQLYISPTVAGYWTA